MLGRQPRPHLQQMCRLMLTTTLPTRQEPELFRRVGAQMPGPEGAAVAKALHTELWGLIVDAKSRTRRPDGSIVTEEEEEAERVAMQEEVAAKAAQWAEREAHMRQGRQGDNPM